MNIIQNIKSELIYQLENFPIKKIEGLVFEIYKSNNIYLTGVGKSGTLALHTTNLLKSLAINAFYLNPLDSLHGDIGTIKDNDLIIMFSKSGNTVELVNLTVILKNKKVKIVGICCNEKSKFSDICDETIILQMKDELSDNISTLPTNSCMAQLLFCNVLSTKIAQNININDYRSNHPSGTIGLKLTTIKDKIIYDYPKFVIADKILLHDIFLKMTKYKLGCCFFVDSCDVLIGILTDGDIRRLLLLDSSKQYITIDNLNTNFVYEENINKFLSQINVKVLPILNNSKLIGVVTL